jgi:hypothetical protein
VDILRAFRTGAYAEGPERPWRCTDFLSEPLRIVFLALLNVRGRSTSVRGRSTSVPGRSVSSPGIRDLSRTRKVYGSYAEDRLSVRGRSTSVRGRSPIVSKSSAPDGTSSKLDAVIRTVRGRSTVRDKRCGLNSSLTSYQSWCLSRARGGHGQTKNTCIFSRLRTKVYAEGPLYLVEGAQPADPLLGRIIG